VSGQAVAVSTAVGNDRPHENGPARVADLFDAHHARLFRLARRLVSRPDDPSDLVQETFLRAARAPERVPRGRQHEEAWLVRVLINVCRDSWRQAAVRTRAGTDTRVRPPAPVHPESGMMAHAMVWRALDALPPRRRAILILYELEGTAIPAIARLLGITPVTVRWHLMRGRREMATALGGRDA
jgi:RNA polymerase sigma-70 factor (ECF subfamily)